MKPTKTIIKLSYDIVSPWSYFAYEILKRYRTEWNLEIILNPIWLGAVMIGSGNSPPMTVPNKGKYMSRNRSIKYNHPSQFPTNTLKVMRILRIIQQLSPSKLESSTNKLYEAMFITGSQIEDLSITKSILTPILNSSTLDQYISLSETNECKSAMKQAAQELVEKGAFGFPWLEVVKPDGDRLTIFGSDRFEFLAHWLGVKWYGPSFNHTNLQTKL
ncbi:uncharacterized protein MELLADRAFT_94402 [Melampsora larici-populina 98AG31]|uniref:Glutathione S-transferase kappa 1 n=1 Tax=Melampsora larici-populina (strain 98AG31 / pathotype 3-4-7) TaxID=747676 RepID=F4RBE0_MELLP|nr:uncharacterized protein MELLADRAFT_94402 [Melampsora larici-populina 98AG31]EGG10376.1 hypothetical protein MELLADRAFT_94402 [Melampsora larici-populina 98AG31]